MGDADSVQSFDAVSTTSSQVEGTPTTNKRSLFKRIVKGGKGGGKAAAEESTPA